MAAKLPHGPDGRGMCDGPTAAAEATSFPILLVIRPSQLCSGIPDSEDRNAGQGGLLKSNEPANVGFKKGYCPLL